MITKVKKDLVGAKGVSAPQPNASEAPASVSTGSVDNNIPNETLPSALTEQERQAVESQLANQYTEPSGYDVYVSDINKLKNTFMDKGDTGGTIDVAKNYAWTPQPRDKIGAKIPTMTMKEFEMDGNYLFANIKYWSNGVKQGVGTQAVDAYKGLYKAKSTNTKYIFPWYQSFNHAFSQSWADYPGVGGLDYVKNLAGAYAFLQSAVKGNAAGMHINNPKIWQGAQCDNIPYKIILFNTIGDSQTQINKNIEKNRKLKNRLIAVNLHNQKSIILATPPVLYEVEIAGVIHSPATVIQNLNIENLGVLKMIDGQLVPEAYGITFILQPLITESRQIFSRFISGDKPVVAIDSGSVSGEGSE